MSRRTFSISLILVLLLFSAVLLGPRNNAHASLSAAGSTNTATVTKTPTSMPGSEFVGTPLSGTAPLAVQFTHTNPSILSSCQWTFGDGTIQAFTFSPGTSSTCPSVTHTYTSAGSFTVKLSVTKATNGWSGSTTKPNYIQVGGPTPTPTLTPSVTPTIIVKDYFTTVTTSAASVNVGGSLDVTVVTNVGNPRITLIVIDAATGVEQSLTSPIFTPAQPDARNFASGYVTATWTLTAARAGTVFFRANASGEMCTTFCIQGIRTGQSGNVTVNGSSITLTPTLTPTLTRTNTPTVTPTRTGGKITLTPPSATPTKTPTPVIGACSPVNATITAPFTQDGIGTFCWQSSNLGGFINNYNMTSLTINSVNETNVFVPAAAYPAKINGFWYVKYVGNFPWSHFETKP